MSHLSGKSGSSSARDQSKRWGDTTSKRGELSRVFIGNVDPQTTNTDDLENKFMPYGKIQGIDVNPNGFAFVQFDNVTDANRAVQSENGTVLRGKKIEVRMFDKGGPPKKRGASDRSRSPVPRGPPSMSGPPRMHQGPPSYGPPGAMMPPMPPQGPPPPGNDVEIIVVNRDIWEYAEMLERRIRNETSIKYVDLLFLHSPQHMTMTLNDLFERRTLYALVCSPVNEEHKSVTLHILHKQTEHRNMPVDDAIALISHDFRNFIAREPGFGPEKREIGPTDFNRPAPPPSHPPLTSANGSSGNPMYSSPYSAVGSISEEKRLPEEISYLLRTTLSEDGVQFLSLQQIDSLINYFTHERERLTSTSKQNLSGNQANRNFQSSYGVELYNQQQQNQPSASSQHLSQGSTATSSQSASQNMLLDNPQVKAALNSLLSLGAIGGNSNLSNLATSLANFSYGNKSIGENQGSIVTSASATSEAPSYLSTSAPTTSLSNSIVSPYQTQNVPHGNLMQGGQAPPRRHPLLGTEIGSSLGSATNLMGSYGGGGNRLGVMSNAPRFQQSGPRY